MCELRGHVTGSDQSGNACRRPCSVYACQEFCSQWHDWAFIWKDDSLATSQLYKASQASPL